MKLQFVYDVLGNFKAVIARANEVPTRKFVCPQTEGQEYGWISQPLVCTDISAVNVCNFPVIFCFV